MRIGPNDGSQGVAGHVYQFKGPLPETIDLATEDFTVIARWTDLTVQPSIADFYPNLGNLTKSDARAIGLLIVMNDLRAKSEAYLDNAVVTADGSVTVNAEETAQLLSEATSTVSASGGSFYGTGSVQAITGQVVTNVVLASATATISDSDVTAGGDVNVTAANHAGIDATLLAATNSGDLAFAISLAFNSVGWHSQNILFNLVDTILGDPLIAAALNGEDPSLVSATITNSTIDAGGDINVIAIGAALLNATVSNAADSTASALFNATGKAIGLTVAQNKVSSQAIATIEDSEVTAGGDLTVRAADEAGIFSNIKIVSSSQTTNDGGAAVLQDEINNFLNGAKFLSSDGLQTLVLGDKVRITADQAAGTVKKGALYEWMGEDGPVDLTTTDYSDLGLWRPVAASTAVPVGLNVTNSDSMGIGAAIVLNDVWSDVEAALRNVTNLSAASVTVEALESATIIAAADVSGYSAGGSSLTGNGQSLAAGGIIATNRVQSGARAIVDQTPIETTAGDVIVNASNDSLIDATNLVAMQSGSQSVAILLALQHRRLGPLEPALRGGRRAPRRSARSPKRSAATSTRPRRSRPSRLEPDHLRRRRLSDRDEHGADRVAPLERRDLGAGGDHGRRRHERRRDPRLEHGQQPRPGDRRGRRDRRRRRRDGRRVRRGAASTRTRRCTPRSHRPTTPAPASSTSGRTSRSPSTSSRSTPARATSSSATRCARTTGRSTSTWARPSRSTSAPARAPPTSPTSATGRCLRRST